MFKNKIETKAKEEMKLVIKDWLAELSKKGIQYENYNSVRKRLSSNDDQLHHGVEKNIDLNKLPKVNQFIIIAKNKVREYLQKNSKFVIKILFAFILLIYLFRIYSLLLKIERDNSELSEKYDILIREIGYNNFLCKK